MSGIANLQLPIADWRLVGGFTFRCQNEEPK